MKILIHKRRINKRRPVMGVVQHVSTYLPVPKFEAMPGAKVDHLTCLFIHRQSRELHLLLHFTSKFCPSRFEACYDFQDMGPLTRPLTTPRTRIFALSHCLSSHFGHTQRALSASLDAPKIITKTASVMASPTRECQRWAQMIPRRSYPTFPSFIGRCPKHLSH